MAKQNIGLISFNRGLISPKALARIDLDRTALSAEVMTNWLPKTQGAMAIRPGTKHLGSSLNDTGAEYIEFVAATDDIALLELTHQKMRIWIDDELLGRPPVNTTVSLTDTGWSDASSGGAIATAAANALPTMTDSGTGNVAIGAKSFNTLGFTFDTGGRPWMASDGAVVKSRWQDTGVGQSNLPSWWTVNFDTGTIADTGRRRAITSYSLQAPTFSSLLTMMPKRWTLYRSNFDTGSNAFTTPVPANWVAEDTQGSETGWSVSEERTYRVPGADTGTVEAYRHWVLYFQGVNSGTSGDSGPVSISEIEMFTGATTQQVKLQGGQRVLNATAIGSLARAKKRVMVSDTGTEHSLSVYIARGPVTIRVGSTDGNDDLISETSLGTGYHNLAFTPQTTEFHITLQSDDIVDRIVGSLAIGDSGTVELTAPWQAADLDNVRYDQSADVIFVDCDGISPRRIERRGSGRSWSVINYAPDNGPFRAGASSTAKLSVSQRYGNTTLSSDIPYFRSSQVGALIRIFNTGQSGVWPLGALDAATDAIEVTGIADTGDTGSPSEFSERRLDISVTGTWSGTIQIERSFDGPEFGFHAVSRRYFNAPSLTATDTGTFSRSINDHDNNVTVWYRARITAHSSGAAIVTWTYKSGGINGIARITDFQSNQAVGIEVLSRFSDTAGSDSWQEDDFSARRGYPTAVALHGGRLAHAKGGSIYLSVSDDYENFDEETEGDAAPIIRTLGSGPVDNIVYLVSLLRLIIGTSGAEIAVRSSSLDEPLTPTNCGARAFSTQGSAGLRALRLDSNAVFVQRAGKRAFMTGPGTGADSLGDYDAQELTLLVPDLLEAGVVSLAVQRQPDTRIHFVLGDGRVAILTYEPQEQVLCWSMWQSDTGTFPTVERVAVLPGEGEDRVYYHIRRVVNGAAKRFLERWASESETIGDTGLTFIMDCARSYTDTGRNAALVDIAKHLVGESVVVWSDDTGSIPGVDRSPDVNGVQTRYTVDTGGDVTLTVPVHHSVAGLPFRADYKSSKLAYAAEAGTPLTQKKRVPQLGLVLYRTHNNGLFFGNDTGRLDPLPRKSDEGAEVDSDRIFDTLDLPAVAFPGGWNADSRLCLRGKSPRPVTVLAAVPTVNTNEK